MNTTWDPPTRRTAAIILLVLLVYVIYLSQSIVPFLIIAGLIAFLLAPIVGFLEQKLRFPKILAVIVAYLLLVLAILLVPLILIPAFIDAFGDINIDLAMLTRQILTWLQTTLEAYRTFYILGIPYDLSPLVDPALEMINNVSPSQFIPSLETLIASIPSTIQLTWGIASNVLGTLTASLLAFILTLLYSIYLTVDGSTFIRAGINLVPPAYRPEFIELHRRIKSIWSAYFRGQFLLGVIIGTVTWIIGMIIGLPGALALGVIAGVLEILPNLGPILAAIPALLVALVQGSKTLEVSNLTFVLIVLAAYVLIQQFENNLIVPKILGDAVELHPLVVMVGVVVGATIGGILGALIAAPTVASFRVLVAYTYAKILTRDPFPPDQFSPLQPPSLTKRVMVMYSRFVEWRQKQQPPPKK